MRTVGAFLISAGLFAIACGPAEVLSGDPEPNSNCRSVPNYVGEPILIDQLRLEVDPQVSCGNDEDLPEGRIRSRIAIPGVERFERELFLRGRSSVRVRLCLNAGNLQQAKAIAFIGSEFAFSSDLTRVDGNAFSADLGYQLSDTARIENLFILVLAQMESGQFRSGGAWALTAVRELPGDLSDAVDTSTSAGPFPDDRRQIIGPNGEPFLRPFEWSGPTRIQYRAAAERFCEVQSLGSFLVLLDGFDIIEVFRFATEGIDEAIIVEFDEEKLESPILNMFELRGVNIFQNGPLPDGSRGPFGPQGIFNSLIHD